MKPHKDQRYIQALLSNDTQVIKEIYRNNAEQVSRWVRKNSGSADDAQDIFQEALIALYTKASKGDFQLTAPFGALLLRICKNKWIDRLRKKSRSPEVRMEDEARHKGENTHKLAEEIETTSLKEQILEQTFQQLSDLCRKVLKLLSEGLPSSEVALRVEMSNANSVYRRKKACTDRWRDLYQMEAKKADL